MEPFTQFTAKALPIDQANMDTDQIIPVRYLKRARNHPDYPSFLFHDLRFKADGAKKPGFIFNQPQFKGAKIVVANENWGCGSSREAAVYALLANGIRSVIAPSFGDIHYSNGMKNGMLPVRLSKEDCDTLRAQIHTKPEAEITVDLEAQTVTGPDGTVYAFEIDPFQKHCVLNGLDDVGVTLTYEAEIEAFEARYRKEADWLF